LRFNHEICLFFVLNTTYIILSFSYPLEVRQIDDSNNGLYTGKGKLQGNFVNNGAFKLSD